MKHSAHIIYFLLWTAFVYDLGRRAGHDEGRRAGHDEGRRERHDEVREHALALREIEALQEHRKQSQLAKMKAREEFKNSESYMLDHGRL